MYSIRVGIQTPQLAQVSNYIITTADYFDINHYFHADRYTILHELLREDKLAIA